MIDAAATCTECDAASRELHHVYRSDCRGCKARALARSPLFHAARISGKQFSAYRRALELADLSHDDVKRASANDFEVIQRAAQPEHR